MDTLRGFDDDRADADHIASDGTDDGVDNARFDIGTDERRMHVRAYNHWVSLLQNRAYPSIEDLDPANIADFGPHSVLLDFSAGIEDPSIAFLGRALREECALDSSITHISQVPGRSLLSRLTDHYLQIIANRAPIGFEAEFVGTRGFNTMYRGILMPFSSDDDTIDFIYGVINWKELVDAETQAKLTAELDVAIRTAPQAHAPAAAWADGPSAGLDEDRDDHAGASGDTLPDRLMLARETAAAVHAADVRGRTTLYRALGRAHDFALAAAADADGYAALLANAGITVQARAPMTAVAKLVFGATYDKTRLTEFAAVLSYANRRMIGAGDLPQLLEEQDGGIKAVVKAERAWRKPAAKSTAIPTADIALRAPLATLVIETDSLEGDYVVLLARTNAQHSLDIVAAISGDAALTRHTIRRAAA